MAFSSHHARASDTAPLADEVTLARYPFLPQASDWIRNMAGRHGIDLNELLEGTWMEQARQRARIRLIDSVQSKEGVQVVGATSTPKKAA